EPRHVVLANIGMLRVPASERCVDVLGRQISQVSRKGVNQRPGDADIAQRLLARRVGSYDVSKLKQKTVDRLIETGPVLLSLVEQLAGSRWNAILCWLRQPHAQLGLGPRPFRLVLRFDLVTNAELVGISQYAEPRNRLSRELRQLSNTLILAET